MKKILNIILAICCSLTMWAQIPDEYYAAVDNKQSSDAILDALYTCIKDHNVISYSALEDYYEDIDFREDGTLWDMYSTCTFTMAQANHTQKQVCDGWNKEHSIPQSWFGEASPMKSDLFHVYPTDARVNNFRSNNPYGEVNGANGTGITKDPENHALGKSGANTFPGYTGTVFEPADEYKGDFARTYFYMVARYRDRALNSSSGSVVFTANKTNLTTYATNLFLRWHRQDPVSQKEVKRNNAVYAVQHNRNPFIDYPELVEYIWGNKKGEQVDLSTMTPTCESITPEATVKYGVTWMVNGKRLRTDSVKANSKPAALPDAPASCSETSESFYGWAGGSWEGALPNYLPMDIIEFSNIAYMPAVTADVTYNAVFAHAEMQAGQGAVTETASFESGYSRGQEVPNTKAGIVTITFSKAGASNSAKFYTELRCYAKSKIELTGATMTKIEFVAGTNDKGNELTPSTGKMSNSSTWTGEASSVTFTVGGDSGYRGIIAIRVTYNDNTTITTYNAFRTSCIDGEHTAATVEHSDMPTARKVLIGGQLYIVVGDATYSVTGQKVQTND